MGRYEIPAPDELVELHEVDMPRVAGLWPVKDDEQVIGICVDLRKMAALEDVPNGEIMEAEAVRQRTGHLVVARSDIDPDEAILSLEQGRHVRPCERLDRGR
jgi:hypothetical protein